LAALKKVKRGGSLLLIDQGVSPQIKKKEKKKKKRKDTRYRPPFSFGKSKRKKKGGGEKREGVRGFNVPACTEEKRKGKG